MLWDHAFPSIHRQPPLLDFIRGQLNEDGQLVDPLCQLPDEVLRSAGEIIWMAGALDGAMGHHFGVDEGPDDRAGEIAEAVVTAARHPHRRELHQLYELLSTGDVMGIIDRMVETLGVLDAPTSEVAALGTWLATTSPDRGPVKVGIALLGVTGAHDGALLHDLGSHEEFTLYSATAFTNSRQNPEPDLFLLARRVRGWGRIHCVERLRNTTDPEISRWILTEGFRNSVMNEYLAYIAATTGDLVSAITSSSPDAPTLSAATDIISSLIMGGPAEDIDDYSDAPTVMSSWLGHVLEGGGTVAEFLTAGEIAGFCEGDGWAARIEQGTWSEQQRTSILELARKLLVDPRWKPIILAALASHDKSEFHTAVHAARTIGVDPIGELLARLDADPLGGPWYLAWEDADATRAELLLGRVRQFIDLSAIATGPTQKVGMGPEFRSHAALDWSLQGIASHPGMGSDLIEAALWSPSVRNRNQAMNALVAWGRPNWNHHHIDRLEALALNDPDEGARVRAIEVLETLPPAPI